MSNMNISQIQIHLISTYFFLQILRFQTLFVSNTNACGQRERERERERDSKAGQAEARGGFGGETGEETMKEREFIGRKTKAGHQ